MHSRIKTIAATLALAACGWACGQEGADAIAKAYVEQLSKANIFRSPIVTKIEPVKGFYPAEDYHQDFLIHNPTYPYIVRNDLPKIAALKRVYPELYRETPVMVSGGR